VQASIDMSELTEMGRALVNSAPEQARAGAKKATVAEGRNVKSRASAGAPKDRPWLSTHIRMRTWNNPDSVAVNVFAEMFDPEGRPVAVFVEHGTSVMAPQPFMMPAGMPSESALPAAIAAAVDPFSKDTDGGPDE
jgi:hypothetical protein